MTAAPITIAEVPAGHHAWWTVEQLAERWQIPVRGVRLLLRRGALKGHKPYGTQWRVPAAEVRRYEASTRASP